MKKYRTIPTMGDLRLTLSSVSRSISKLETEIANLHDDQNTERLREMLEKLKNLQNKLKEAIRTQL